MTQHEPVDMTKFHKTNDSHSIIGAPQQSSEMFSGLSAFQSVSASVEVVSHDANVWLYDGRPIVYALRPENEDDNQKSGWTTLPIAFNYKEHRQNVTVATKCYGYWATFMTDSGTVTATTCIRAYPTWMNDMRDHIGHFKMRDLFLVGSHDSGSYRGDQFDPHKNETLVTKYSITQVCRARARTTQKCNKSN